MDGAIERALSASSEVWTEADIGDLSSSVGAIRRFGLASAQLAEEEHAVLAQSDETLRLDLARAIESLPPQYRTVVIMRDMEERTVGEIADALHLTREAVKGRLHRARSLLREYLVR